MSLQSRCLKALSCDDDTPMRTAVDKQPLCRLPAPTKPGRLIKICCQYTSHVCLSISLPTLYLARIKFKETLHNTLFLYNSWHLSFGETASNECNSIVYLA